MATTSLMPVTMVMEATQTDSCVEIGYQELCGSLSSAAAAAMCACEEDAEFEMFNIADRKQHVKSSQTDLTLSELDLGKLEWENEDEAEDGREEGKLHRLLEYHNEGDKVYNYLEASDSNAKEQIFELSLNNSGNSGALKTSAAYETLMSLNKPCKEELPVPLVQGCFRASGKLVLNDFVKRRCRMTRPLHSYCGMRILLSKMSRMQLGSDLLQASYGNDAVNQPQFSFRNRMVPRMGTKVEILKNLPQHQVLQMPKEIGGKSQISSEVIYKAVSDMKTDQPVIDLFTAPESQSSYIFNVYHSDSEHSYISIREKNHHKEWSSDGDADSLSQTLNDEIRQSINFINTELLSPENRSRVESIKQRYEQFAGIMYTNEANLQHTIMIQQCLFKQQLACHQKDRGEGKAIVNPSNTLSPGEPSLESAGDASGTQEHAATSQNKCKYEKTSHLEWIAKRRPDGSRYITRRPVRSRFLQEQAKRCLENLPSSDDDTASEAKIGHYWSREERKYHLKKTRRQKCQKERQLNMHACSVKEELSKLDATTSQRQHKISKYQSRKILEKFTTLKDLMLYRGADNKGKSFSPLLSVTTI